MKIAIVCRQAIYDRLSGPLLSQNADISVSPALFQWNDALNYLRTNKVDGIVLEEGVAFFEQIKSMPLPLFLYSRHNGYSKDVSSWIQSLKVETDKSFVYERKEQPKKAEPPLSPQKPEKEKQGIKLLLVSKTKSITDYIPTIQQVNVIRTLTDPQLILDSNERLGAEVILIEEGVLGDDPVTIRELKLLQLVEELKDSDVRLTFLLFHRDNKRLTSKLIDRGFYNFIAGKDLDALELETLIKRPFTKEDVKNHYQSNLVDIEEQQKAVEMLQRTDHLVSDQKVEVDNAPVGDEVASTEEMHGWIDQVSSSDLIHMEEVLPETQLGSEKTNTTTSEPEQKQSDDSDHAVNVNKREREQTMQPDSNKNQDEERTSTLGTIAFNFKRMPSLLGGAFTRKENPRKNEPTTSKVETENISKELENLAGSIFAEGVPHRVVIYSPKGGSNASTVAIELAESSKNHNVGVIEVAYSFGQLAGRLDIQPKYTLIDLEDGMEEYAICNDKYLLAPWLFPVKKQFNEKTLMEWLGRGQRAFSGRTILADLQSQSSPLIQYYAMQWSTRVIWTVQDTKDHLGMADLQLSQLKKMGDNEWQKIGILVQEVTGEKLPWEEVLGVPVIGILPKERRSKKWKDGLNSSVAEHLGLYTYASAGKAGLGRQR